MNKPPYCFKLLTHFSVINVVKNLNQIEQLTLEIESNGSKHSLVLIEPWPPFSRPIKKRLDDISGLCVKDIDSVCAFKDSNIIRIEITKKNKEIESIRCKDIKGLPDRTDDSDQTQ